MAPPTAHVDLRQPGLITKEITSTSFSFYDAEEARRISVKRISNPVLFDALSNPVADGLYDPALGPIDQRGSCATCRLGAMHCPGHFGHIELAVPVYNPLTFSVVVRLLRSACLHCGKFKLAADRVAAYRERLRLIREGDLEGAANVDVRGVSKQTRAELNEIREMVGDLGTMDTTHVSRVIPVAHQGRRKDRVRWTSHAMMLSRDLVKEFLAATPGKCENCGVCSPKVSPEGANKISRAALTKKQIEHNAALTPSVDLEEELRRGLSGPDRGDDDAEPREDGEDLAGQEVEPDEGGRIRRRRRRKKKDATGLESSDEDDDEEEEEADDDDDDDDVKDEDSDSKKRKAPSSEPATPVANGAAPAPAPAKRQVFITPIEARSMLKKLWANEYDFVSMVWVANAPSYDAKTSSPASSALDSAGALAAASALPERRSDPARFFMQTVLVTPCRFRPPSKMNDMMFEHPQNTHLNAIIQANLTLAELFRKPPTVPEPPEVRAQRAVRAWLTLQGGVNRLVDSSKAEGGEAGGMGIRQQLEKKQGLFRMNMMGKRVNYAARSVIMPDPYLKTSEIGVPPVFAKKLTFPENVTAHNVELMRQLVENGPDIHPGANAIEDERGRVIHLDRFTAEKRAAIAKTLLATPATTTGEATAAAAGMSLGGAAAKAKTPASVASKGNKIKFEDDDDDDDDVDAKTAAAKAAVVKAATAAPSRPLAKKVFRHLRDGDVLLVNRQPTLHKPGIMAHTAKVLPGQRTIRMHYANCSTYNADFDGDEMNLHFPQDHLARAEAYEIVRADQQYTVPTDGKPLRGLIQDHICAGVLMTCRDTFLDKSDFTQLMYLALVDFAGAEMGGGAVVGKSLKPPAPAIRKPRALWTGKQLFTAVIEHITHGRAPMTVSHATKVPANYWGGEDSGEGVLVVRRNYVCSGILDKNTFGAHGLVHAVAELHGKVLAGDFISVLTRLLTAFLQRHGMTCGMDDLILHEESERGREEELHKATAACRGAAAAFAEADVNVPEMALRKQIAARLSEREGAEAALDMRSSGALAKVTSATVKRCLPHGTKKPFPKNCLSLMTQSGAKGSMVNFSQIAACLGQQELEGRRVPRMISGKTLPCFPPHDTSERAGGYVSDRFFSGLRPQEYYFHCMAGREGLVDTAVKTSRSGYLQRCLVKNLEPLRVHYDHTVRDCDGSIVQFHYGDDAVDVTKGGYLEKFQFLADNPELLRANLAAAEKDIAALRVIDEADEDEEKDASGKHPALPVMSSRPLSNALGTLPERFKDNLDAFIQRADPAVFANGGDIMEKKPPPKAKAAKKKPTKKEKEAAEAKAAAAAAKPPGLPALSGMTADEFKRLMNLRYLSALASPGEAVGCVAAQSVGEPSTQMTLNTFHFAGRGEANVTLGIPRLRELLMAASKKLATPVMTLPLRDGARNREDATALARRLRKVRLAELVRKLKVAERPCARSHGGSGELARVYTVTVELRGPVEADADEGNEHVAMETDDGSGDDSDSDSDSESGADAIGKLDDGKVTFRQMARAFKRDFARRLHGALKMELRKRAAAKVAIQSGKMEGAARVQAVADDAGAADDGDDEKKVASAKRASNKRILEEEEGENGEDSDEEDEEEGAKAEDRKDARGDDGEGFSKEEEVVEEEKASKAHDMKEEEEEEEEEGSDGSDDDDDSGSDDTDTDGEDLGDSDSETEKRPPAKKKKPSSSSAAPAAKNPKKATHGGGDLLETLEDIVDGVVVDPRARTCTLTVSLRLGAPPVLIMEACEAAAANTTVRHVPGIDKTFVIGKDASEDPNGLSPLMVQTDGVNFAAAWANDDLVDCANVKTNDVYAMMQTYGVEAARETLVAEVRGVFGVYGIAVDARHLSLIGDFMMAQGDYRPCSRAGMETSTSPLLKMSFETAAAFLVDATMRGQEDTLESPSARIVLGRTVDMGTGTFGLRYDMKRAAELREEMKKNVGVF
jgi:DNA-directed RNA polymerase I subunit RPA1